jgi:F-type H+-transporting ATPase subunit b
MTDEIQGTATVGTASSPAAHGSVGGDGYMSISLPMMLMTWGVFLATAFLLYRVAWKPILHRLANREEKIRKSLEEAQRASQDAAATETRCREMLAQAESQARVIVENGRVTAEQLSRTIEARAHEDAVRLTENARREIESATVRAQATLRRETAELAVAIAGKVLHENMDSERNRALAARLAEKL